MMPFRVLQMRQASAAPVVAPNPAFANVKSLNHFDGTNGSTTFTDQIAGVTWSRTVTGTSTITLSTTAPKFGTASAMFNATPGNAAYLEATGLPASIAGDFCVECWLTLTDATDGQFPGLFDFIDGDFIVYLIDNGNSTNAGLDFFDNSLGGPGIGGTQIVYGTATHIAVSRSGGLIRGWVNGSQVCSQTGNTRTLTLGRLRLGEYAAASSFLRGRMDDFRLTVGEPVYTAAFIPPTAALPDS